MHILVTGVGGFIGSKVAARLAQDGHHITGVDDFSSGHRANVPDGIELVEVDLAATEAPYALPQKCDVILHLAGQSSGDISFDDPVSDLHKNTISTQRLIHYGIERGVQRLVYASSMSTYGPCPDAPVREAQPLNPLSCYGVGKLAAEGYLRVYADRLPFVSLRMFNVYGPGQNLANLRQGMVSIFLAQALSGEGKVHVKGSLDRFRDFIYIDDVVDVWCRVATSSVADNRVLNLGTGRRTTVGELLDAMKIHVPHMSWYSEGGTPGDQFGVYADTTELCETLDIDGFTQLEDALGTFTRWATEAMRDAPAATD